MVPFPTESGATLKKALQVNPQIKEAKEGLDEINKVIQERDKVLIKFK